MVYTIQYNYAHAQLHTSYFSEECAGISCQVAVGLPAVQLFAGKLDPPRDLLLGCENILVFVVSQKKTENLMTRPHAVTCHIVISSYHGKDWISRIF